MLAVSTPGGQPDGLLGNGTFERDSDGSLFNSILIHTSCHAAVSGEVSFDLCGTLFALQQVLFADA